MESFITSPNLNTLGLGLDIAGVLLLFFFGLPPKVNRGGVGYLVLEDATPSEKSKAKRNELISWLALFFLVVGFGLQIASNYL